MLKGNYSWKTLLQLPHPFLQGEEKLSLSRDGKIVTNGQSFYMLEAKEKVEDAQVSWGTNDIRRHDLLENRPSLPTSKINFCQLRLKPQFNHASDT